MWKHPDELNKIEDFSRPIIYWTWKNKCGVLKDNIVFFGGGETLRIPVLYSSILDLG